MIKKHIWDTFCDPVSDLAAELRYFYVFVAAVSAHVVVVVFDIAAAVSASAAA